MSKKMRGRTGADSIDRRGRSSGRRARAVVKLVAASAAAHLAALGVTRSASAQVAPTHTWVGTTSDNWSTGTWSPSTPTSVNTAVLQFNASGSTSYTATNDIATPFVLNGLLLNNTGSGTITLAGTLPANALDFQTNGTATPVLNILGTGASAIGNNLALTHNLTIGGAGTGALSLSGSLSGTGTLTLRAPANVTLSGNNTGYTADALVARGTLVLDYGSDTNAKLGGAFTFGNATLGAGGGTLSLLGNGGAAITQTFSAMTLNPGAYTLGVTTAGGQNANVTATTFTRNIGGTLALSLSDAAATFTASAAANGTVLGWATAGNNFVKQSGTGLVTLVSGDYTDQPNVASWAAGQNITNDAAAYTGTLGANLSINSLRFNNATPGTVALGANTLTVATGGILLTSAVTGNSTISGTGNLTTGANTQDLIITNKGSGTLSITSNIGASASVATNPAAITSSGNVTLGSSSTAPLNFTAGGLFINSGTFTVINNTAGGTSNVTMDNSAAAQANPLGRSSAGTSPVTLADGTTLTMAMFSGTATTGATYTFGNPISVPAGTATLKIDRQAGSFAGKVAAFGGLTIGDGARLNYLGNTTITASSGYNTAFSLLTLGAGAGNQPTTHTLSITGGQNTGSNVALQTGAISGTSTGGATLNLIGTTHSGMILPGLNLTAAAGSNFSAFNISGTARVFVSSATALGTAAVSVGSGSILTSNGVSVNLSSQSVTVAQGGGLTSRTSTFTVPTAGLPSSGLLILQHENNSNTGALSLNGNYPALTGNPTFQFGGPLNTSSNNSLGATTLTGNLDASSPALGGMVTVTADYAAVASSTNIATNLFTVSGTTSLGANNLTVAGDGAMTLNAITTTGPGTNTVTKTGTGFLTMAGANTFSGGVSAGVNAGLRVGANSTVSSGAIASSPFGTGTLTLGAGATLQDNGAARTIHNSVVLSGNTTFSSSTGTFSLTLEDAGLTSASTLTINAATNPTLTVTNSTTFSQAISLTGGATGFTKAGAGTLTLDGDYIDTGTVTVSTGTLVLTPNATTGSFFSVLAGAAIRVEGHHSAFDANNDGFGEDARVTLASGATAIRGAGVDVTEFQQWLGTTGSTDVVVAIPADSDDAYDFSGNSGRRLGSLASGFVYTGNLTPDGTTYRLGGGGGVLYYGSALASGNSLDVGLGSTTAGGVVLLNTGNAQTSTKVVTGGQVLARVGTLGSGAVNLSGGTLFAGGALTVTNLTLDTGGGTINTNNNNVSLGGTITGTTGFTKAGPGTLTLTDPLPAGNVVALTAGSVTTALTGTPLSTGNFTLGGSLNLTAGSGNVNIANAAVGTTFAYSGGTVSFGASGGGGLTVTAGNAGATTAVFTRSTGGFLVLAPANGTASLGTTDKFIVNGLATTPSKTLTNTVVPGYVVGRDNDANGTGTHLTYNTTNGYLPATYTTIESSGTMGAGSTTAITDVTTAPAALNVTGNAYALRTNQTITITPAVVNTSSGLTIGAGGLILNNNANINQTANGTGIGQLTFSGEGLIYTSGTGSVVAARVTGSGGLAIAGPGELRLTNLTNSFTGGSNVNGGILAITTAPANDNATNTTLGGNKAITLRNGGTFRTSASYNPNDNTIDFVIDPSGGRFDLVGTPVLMLDDGGTISGSGPLTLTGGGTLSMGNNQNYSTLGPVYATGATLQITTSVYGTTTLGSLDNALTFNTGGIYDLRATGPRVVVLNGGSLAPASGTGVQNASVYVTANSTIGGAATLTLNAEVVVDPAVTNLTLGGGGTATLNGVISGAANNTYTVTKTGAGTAVLANAQNTYAGGTIVSAGVLQQNTPGAAGGTAVTYRNVSLAGGALNLRNDATTITYFDNVSVDVTGATAAAPNLRVGLINAAVVSPLTVNLGTVTFNGNFTLGTDEVGTSTGSSYSLNFAGTVLNGNGVFDIGGGNTAPTGSLLDPGPISQTGGTRNISFAMSKNEVGPIITLDDASTYSGTTTLSANAANTTTLRITNVAGVVGTGSKTVILNSAGASLDAFNNADATFDANVQVSVSNASVKAGRASAGPGVTATLGNLSIGALNLNTAAGANVDANSAYGVTFGGNTTLTGAATFTVANNGTGAGTLNLNNISGPTFGFTKAGAGTLLVNGTSTYTGATVISAGTLKANSATAFNNTATLTPTAGTLDLNGFNASFTSIAAGAAAATITDNAAGTGTSTLTTSNQAAATVAALVKDGPTRTVAVSMANANTNTPLFTLSSANTYSGGTTLLHSANGTRLSVNALITGTPFGSGPINIGQTATDKAGIFFSSVTGITLANPIVFNTELGTDRYGIRTDVANTTLSGTITTTAGVNAVFYSNTTTGAINLTNQVTGPAGLVLDLSQTTVANTSVNVTLNNTTASPNNYQGDTVVGRTNAAPTVNYAATLTLGAANQIPNGATAGNVVLNNNNASRTGTLSLGGFDETINGLSGNGTLDGATTGTPTNTLTLGDNDAIATFTGVIKNTAGTLGVTKIGGGTQTFSGTNTYAGPTTVNAGTLAFSAAGNLGNDAVGNTVTVSGGTLSYTGMTATTLGANQSLVVGTGHATVNAADAGGTVTFLSASGNGNLNKTGPGKVVLTGTTDLDTVGPTDTGGVTVSGGTLQAGFGTDGAVTLNVAAGGFLNMQNAAAQTLTLNGTTGNLSLAAGSALGFELDGTTNDRINTGVGGTALTAAGNVTLNFFNTGTGIQANTYTLLTADSGLNAATYTLGTAPSGFSYSISQSDTLVELIVSQVFPTYWRGGQNASWNTLGASSANWTDDLAGATDAASVPTGTSKVIFGSTAAPFTSGTAIDTTLDAAFTINDLQFTANPTGVTAVSINPGTGGSLTVSPGSVLEGIAVAANAGAVTISAPLTADSNQTWSVDGTGANGSSLIISGATTFTGSVNKTGAGAVTISGTGNSGAGGFTLTAGTLNLNSDSALGTGTLTIAANTTINSTVAGVDLANNAQTWNGSFTFTGSQNLNMGTGGVTLGAPATVTTTANTLSAGGISGAFALTKAGTGALVANGSSTVSAVAVNAGAITFNGTTNSVGALTTAASTTTTFAGTTSNAITTLIGSGGTIAANEDVTASGALTFNTGTTTINTGATKTFTVNNAVTIGPDTVGNVTLGTDASFVMNAPTQNFVLGNRTSVAASPANTFNASAARNVEIYANTVQIGTVGIAPTHTGTNNITFTLPTGTSSTSTIEATTSILVGLGDNEGAGLSAFLNLGRGTNTITTPQITLGEQKTGAQLAFQSGAGSLTLSEAGGDGKTNLTIGQNPLAGTATNQSSVMNLTTSGTVNATLGDIVIATGITTNAGGGAQGTFTLGASGGGIVTADTVAMGATTSASTTPTYTSTFNLTAGTFQFNAGGTGFVQGAGAAVARTSTIAVSGGLLDMNNKPINAVSTGAGTSTLTVSGGEVKGASTIGNFTNLTFSGGTIRNNTATTAIARSLPQTATVANSLLDITTGTTTIAGTYSLVGNGPRTASGTVASGATLSPSGAVTVGAVASTGPAVLTVNGTLDTTTGVTINVNGTLAGGGTVSAPITVASGGTISPGTSAGTLITGAQTWGPGGIYALDLPQSALDSTTPGLTTTWDLLSFQSASLDVTASDGSDFFINPTTPFVTPSLIGGDTVSPDGTRWYTIARAATVNGFNASDFELPNGWTIRDFDIDLNPDGSTTQLSGGGHAVQVAVPEPTGLGVLGIAAAALMGRRRRRRTTRAKA